MKEAGQKWFHMLWFHLHKILENANQSTVTASDPWFLVEGCEEAGGGGMTKEDDMSEDNGYVYCCDYDDVPLGVYIC